MSLLVLLCVYPLFIKTAAAQSFVQGDLTLSEFQADTATVADYYGEWFEIYNNSGASVDIQGLTFRHSTDAGSSFQEFTIASELRIGAADYLVFGVSGNYYDDCRGSGVCDYNGNVVLDYQYDFFGAPFDLSKDADHFYIIAYDAAMGGAEVMLDEVEWGPTWSVAADYAHQVAPNALKVEWANDASINWCPSDTYIEGSAMHGSPGEDNHVCGTESSDDNDGDGFSENDDPADCRDDLADVHPYDYTNYPDQVDGADDTPGNMLGWDDDCDGVRDDGIEDNDEDGYAEVDGDCDDTDPGVFPRANETNDGEDDDCNGCIDDADDDGDGITECIEYRDLDGDGAADDAYYDCNDADGFINPLAEDVPRDGIDQDCNGEDECDVDDDGYKSIDEDCTSDAGTLGTDCNDDDTNVHPNAVEDYSDGIDNDCDGIIDRPDRDEDGFTEEDGDCMDIGEDESDDPALRALSQTVNPSATEACGDLIDNDCDGFYDNAPECANPSAYGTIRGGGLLCGVVDGGEAMGGGALLGLLALARRRNVAKKRPAGW